MFASIPEHQNKNDFGRLWSSSHWLKAGLKLLFSTGIHLWHILFTKETTELDNSHNIRIENLLSPPVLHRAGVDQSVGA